MTTGYFNDNQAIFGFGVGPGTASYNTNSYVLTGLAWPLDRCIHGAPKFANDPKGKGIHKDTTLRLNFYEAREAAVAAALVLIIG